jgi:hypothetical protein
MVLVRIAIQSGPHVRRDSACAGAHALQNKEWHATSPLAQVRPKRIQDQIGAHAAAKERQLSDLSKPRCSAPLAGVRHQALQQNRSNRVLYSFIWQRKKGQQSECLQASVLTAKKTQRKVGEATLR